MSRNRFLILLGGCFLAASAACADDVGYVDCSNHSEGTQVFGKPRKTPDIVGSLHCGERFTILVYGFVFSRIQTGDGKIGYIYSNLIAVDRAASAAQQTGSLQLAATKSKVPSTRTAIATPTPSAPAQPQPGQTLHAPTQAPAPTSLVEASNVPETPATVAQPNPPAPSQPQPTPDQPAPAAVPEPASSVSTSNAPDLTSSVAQPVPTEPERPQPPTAEPAAPSIRPADTRTTWERPIPPSVRRAPLIELYGGYAFARLAGSAGTSSNLNGALGAFGWNLKPWLQIVADSSYSVVTAGGTKNVLYGNHYGPRYFHRSRNRLGLTPFVEALVGGSRSDAIVTGTGGYTTSSNCISYKAGGGLDIHPSRHIDIRLFDVDYYRTSFGANLHQNNYWASTGIVLRLFGGASE